MMLFFGDVHGKFGHVERAVVEHRPQAIILLGDIQANKPLHIELANVLNKTEVWFIHGNHDTDSREHMSYLEDSQLAHRNLHGRVVEIAGLKVAGLGGVFRGEIWLPNPLDSSPKHNSYAEYEQALTGNHYSGKPANANEQAKITTKLLKHRSTIFPQEYEALAAQAADILVTHEAPSCHPHGFAAIDELARCLKVQRAFHAHHHDSLDYRARWDELGFKVYGVGLRGVAGADGEIIQAGELDEARRGRGQVLEE